MSKFATLVDFDGSINIVHRVIVSERGVCYNTNIIVQVYEVRTNVFVHAGTERRSIGNLYSAP